MGVSRVVQRGAAPLPRSLRDVPSELTFKLGWGRGIAIALPSKCGGTPRHLHDTRSQRSVGVTTLLTVAELMEATIA